MKLHAFNGYLFIVSAVHIGATSVLGMWYGAEGLILADCISMGMRIAFSLHFIHTFFATTKSSGSGKVMISDTKKQKQKETELPYVSTQSLFPQIIIIFGFACASAIVYTTRKLLYENASIELENAFSSTTTTTKALAWTQRIFALPITPIIYIITHISIGIIVLLMTFYLVWRLERSSIKDMRDILAGNILVSKDTSTHAKQE